MKTLTCKKEPTYIKRETIKVAVPLVEHIHHERKPIQRVFLNRRSPWRRYYYAKRGRGKNGMAERAISGSGWNWYRTHGKLGMPSRHEEHHALIAIPKTRHRTGKAENKLINTDVPKAPTCHAKRAQPAITAVRTETHQPKTKTRNPESANAETTKTMEPPFSVPDMAGLRNAGTQNIENAAGVIPSASSGEMQKTRTYSAGIMARTREEGQTQTVPSYSRRETGRRRDLSAGTTMAPGIWTPNAVISAIAGALRTAYDNLSTDGPPAANEVAAPQIGNAEAPPVICNIPGGVMASTQQAKAPQYKNSALGEVAIQKAEQPGPETQSVASDRAGSISLKDGASVPIQASDGRAGKISKGPGYISSIQRKTVQLKTTQGAADLPQ
ncbi:hypothetical protein H0O00_00860 [Candidatus Micrarchaeota archaeon]|nr:hypothetical protein [Candidatus Micrarchaeota archaeon]